MPVYLPGLTLGGLGYGGAPYGYDSYGSSAFPRLPLSPEGGYGGAPYGLSSYGSVDNDPPEVSSVNSIDGFTLEIFFDEEMRADADLFDPSNYAISEIFGAPVVPQEVEGGTPGDLGGFTSVVLTHSGSTLGGQYQISISNIVDVSGNPVVSTPTSFYTFGDTPQVEATPTNGRTVLLTFTDSRDLPQDLLTEVEFSPGVEDVDTYSISTDYPVPVTMSQIVQSSTDLNEVSFDLHPMTSAEYELTVGPSEVYNFDGSVLPDDDPNLSGVEVGTGSSVATPSNGLLLTKVAPNSYGWEFGDLSGLLIPGSTFRADFSFNLSATTISPAVSNATLAILSVSDGSVQIDLTLEDVAGIKVIGVNSGSLSTQAPASWETGQHSVTLIRNQRGSFYTLLFDEVPLLSFVDTAPDGAPTIPSGTSVELTTTHDVALFRLIGVDVTASSTLYTSTWNFIHGISTSFTGSSALARGTIFTKRGPLVRGWGDETPATKEDVEVRVNGTAVDLVGVNPYVGEIYPLIPIPLSTPGTVDVEIDYIWFSNPVFPLVGLNTRGLSLNVWNRSEGHTAGSISPTPSSSVGALARNKFPMGIALAPLRKPSPKAIGHRYIGYQKEYSALLNQPTTLLLNQNPRAVSIGGMTAESIRQSGFFNGRTTPTTAQTPWILSGLDAGGVVGDGTYRVVDDTSGPYGVGSASIYYRNVDLSLTTSVLESFRFKVEDYVLDGVFTGVGAGIHDGRHLVLVGALLVDGVKHLGLLLDAESAHLESGWDIGPAILAEADSQSTLTFDLTDLPPGFSSGSRFRIAEGAQAGVYQISECGIYSDGSSVSVTFSPDLPESVLEFGNDSFTILVEVDWETDLLSLRIQSLFPGGETEVYIGGSVSGLVAQSESASPFPAQTALLLPATEKGVAFWGSISRRAENTSVWDFSQYSSSPERLTQTSQGITTRTEMDVLPENDPNDPWYIVGGFGYSQQRSSDVVLVKSTSSSESADFEFSYERVEPFLGRRVSTDFEAKFLVESGVLGSGDARILLGDGSREVVLSTLLYVEDGSSRGLVTDLPQVSISGIEDPTTEGWVKSVGSTLPDPYVQGKVLEITKSSAQLGGWSKVLVEPSLVSYEGLISEARLRVESFTVGSLGIGFIFGSRVPVSSVSTRYVGLTLGATTAIFLDNSGSVVTTMAVTWNDGEFHTFRLLLDPLADLVVLSVDDTVVGSTPLTGFVSSSDEPSAFVETLGTGSFEVWLDSSSCVPLRPTALPGTSIGRTFGVLLRGRDPDDIDSFKIPRTDGTSALNSSLLATPFQMDWRSMCHVRLLWDPRYGVSFYRPDLAPPPYFTGNFSTELTDPSEAWVTVEYRSLPTTPRDRGVVSFGASDPRSITQQRWDFVRYRIRGALNGFGIAPQNMVLNRSFTFKSGELNVDVTPEVVTVNSRSTTRVVVSDSAIYADRVFVVQVADSVLPSSSWSFNASTQEITLSNPLPRSTYPVTISFAPSNPVTKTYLCSQPFSGSVTVLNEGTPPIPKSRTQPSTLTLTQGATLNQPDDDLDPAESVPIVDPYEFVQHVDSEESLYTNVEFCQVEDGESVHLSTLCDGPGPGIGFSEITISGSGYMETESVPEGPAGPWGRQSPVIKGSSSRFSQHSILMASGNGIRGGTLGPGTAILYPNARGPSGNPPVGGMGLNQDFRIVLTDVTPREDSLELYSIMGDNVPPASANPETDPNVDGTPGTFLHGSAAYQLTDRSSTTYSKVGPWGGLLTLNTNSLLAGGAQLNGTEFTLQGGSAIELPVVTSGTIEAAN